MNAQERFTERLRLHMTATGQQVAELSSRSRRRYGCAFRRGWVTAVDAEAKIVRIDDDRVLHYDTLVYGLGSLADTAAVPGVEDYAYTLNSAQRAKFLADRLARRMARTVVVGGSGLTGVESAAEIAEPAPRAGRRCCSAGVTLCGHEPESQGVPEAPGAGAFGRPGAQRGRGGEGTARCGRAGGCGHRRRRVVDERYAGVAAGPGRRRIRLSTSAAASSPMPRCSGRNRTGVRRGYDAGDPPGLRRHARHLPEWYADRCARGGVDRTCVETNTKLDETTTTKKADCSSSRPAC